jgi:D-alanine-D-alanine ligase
MSKIAILRNDVSDSVASADLDVLTQCREIRSSLERAGHEVSVVTCSLDLATARTQLQCFSPEYVFNLVESLGGTDRLMAAATLLLDSMQLPYTGSGTNAILRSGDKLQAKVEMAAAGIPTPAWLDHESGSWRTTERHPATPEKVIVKANFEHASFAMEGDAVLTFENASELQQLLADRNAALGHIHLVEEFISGREFNLSLLEIGGQPQVLAPAEIDFSGLPPDQARIVGASAKWDESSIEYQQTPRRFNFPCSDESLVAELSELAIRCWHLFGVRGYARVDFRVDEQRRPFVLEVNANPCLSRDAGFIAAAEQSKTHYDQVIESILIAANRSLKHVFHSSHSR